MRSMKTIIGSLFAIVLLVPATQAATKSVSDLAYGSASDQKFDVYYDDAATGAPVIMLLHGRNGKKTDWKPYTGFFQDLGFVVVTPQYSETSDAVADMETMYDWIVAHIATYGGNAGKVNVAGTSKGTYLGSTLVYCRKLPLNSFLGLAGLYLADLVSGNASEVPNNCVTAGDPPSFLVHGLADTKAPSDGSVKFDATLAANGIEEHLYLLPGVDHTGAKAATFGDPDNQALRDDLSEFLTRVNSVTAPPPPPPDPDPTPTPPPTPQPHPHRHHRTWFGRRG